MSKKLLMITYMLFIVINNMITLVYGSSNISIKFQLPITVTDSINTKILTIGTDSSGTIGYDPGLDVLAPPPAPPGSFDARLTWLQEDYFTDIRSDTIRLHTFDISYVPESGASSIVLMWDSTLLSALLEVFITDDITGELFQYDMKTNNSLDVSVSGLIQYGLRIKVALYETSTHNIPSGNQPPINFDQTGITMDFSNSPGGDVTVESYNINAPLTDSLTISSFWDITSSMTNGTFLLDLEISYSDEDTTGLTESSLVPAYYDTTDSSWHILPDFTLTEIDNKITVHNLDHFTIFTIGETGAFTEAVLQTDLTVLLQGPFASDTMNTYLQRNALLPLTQPYSGSPWNYSGTETVVSVPADVVDWILVELRTGTDASTKVSERACFVLKDGIVTDLDGVSPLSFEDITDGDYYVVIYHRNHLAIMSALPVTLTSSEAAIYDFASDINSAYTTGPAPMTEVATGVYGMVSGDGNSDNGVDAIDQNTVWIPTNGTPWSYTKFGDYNLDGGIDAIDYNLNWIANNGRGSQVPLGGVAAAKGSGGNTGTTIMKPVKKDISKKKDISEKKLGKRNWVEK